MEGGRSGKGGEAGRVVRKAYSSAPFFLSLSSSRYMLTLQCPWVLVAVAAVMRADGAAGSCGG